MQLDADEDGEPFFKPQQNVIPPDSKMGPQENAGQGDGEQAQVHSVDEGGPGETAQAAAATATVEQEE